MAASTTRQHQQHQQQQQQDNLNNNRPSSITTTTATTNSTEYSMERKQKSMEKLAVIRLAEEWSISQVPLYLVRMQSLLSAVKYFSHSILTVANWLKSRCGNFLDWNDWNGWDWCGILEVLFSLGFKNRHHSRRRRRQQAASLIKEEFWKSRSLFSCSIISQSVSISLKLLLNEGVTRNILFWHNLIT